MKTRLFAMMALQLAIWGAWAPKLFPYMGMLGFSPSQQALVGACWGGAGLLAIFFSNQLVDRIFAAERFMAVSHVLSGICLLGVAYSSSFVSFFLFYFGYSLLYVPTLSVSNAIAFANLPNPAKDFGAVRMGGTVGWVLISWPFIFLLSAHSTADQVSLIFVVAAIASFALALFSLTLPHTPPRPAEGRDQLAWRKTLRLLAKPAVAILFVVTFIDSVVHNGYFVLADAFLTNRVGIAGNLSMVVLSLGQIAEMVTMLILGYVLVRLGWKATMIIGVLGHAARFLVFAFCADSVPAIVAVQLLHGICYAFFFATLYIYVDEIFPSDVRTSAQGLFNLLILGLGNVVASAIFPQILARFQIDGLPNYRVVFLFPAGMAVIAAGMLLIFFRPSNKNPKILED